MSEQPTHDELRATLQLAHMIVTDHEPGVHPTVMRLARALIRFGEATAHYERIITWDQSCQRCGRLLDACYAADKRSEEAESALAVALATNVPEEYAARRERTAAGTVALLTAQLREVEAERDAALARRPPRGVLTLLGLPNDATDQDAVDTLMSVVAEAGLWRAMREKGLTPPEPIPPGTTIAELLELPRDEEAP